MERTFDFDEPFQIKVLALLLTSHVPATTVQPSYFINPILSAVCDSVLALRAEYGTCTASMVETHLLRKKDFQDREYKRELLDILPDVFAEIPAPEQRYVSDLAVQFSRLQGHRLRLMQAVELVQRSDTESLSQLDALFAHPIPNGHVRAPREFYFSSAEKRANARKFERPDVLRSMIPGLDACLKGGGFARKTLTLFAGLPSTGKSFSLSHMAIMSLIQRKRTVFYSVELSKEEIEDRMDAQLSGIQTYDIRNQADTVSAALALRQKMFGDNLIVIPLLPGQARVSDIRNDILDLGREGFPPEVVVVDYAGRLRSETMTREGRHRDLGLIYIDLMGLGAEFNLWMVTAAQCNRMGMRVPLLTTEVLADSFEGAMHPDYVITINRTDEEAAAEIARLYIAKNRIGPDKLIIDMATDFKTGTFFTRRHLYTPGVTSHANGHTRTTAGTHKGQGSPKKTRKVTTTA